MKKIVYILVFLFCSDALTAQSPCPDLINNGGFETFSALPDCSSPPQSYTAALASGWTNGLSSDYLNIISGTLVNCLNYTPNPRTGDGHVALLVGANNNGFYREFVQTQTNTALQPNKTYKITFYYKQVNGNANGNIGVYVSTNQPSSINFLTPLNKFESTNLGWTKVESYYSTPSNFNQNVWLSFGGFIPTALFSGDYFYIDDVSMAESPLVVYTGPTDLCTADNYSVTFSASNASTAYSWVCNPSLNGFPSTNSSVTINGPSTNVVTTTYTVTLYATTSGGCTNSASYQFTIYKTPPTPTIAPSGTLFPCFNSTVTLTTNTTTSLIPSIVWYLNSVNNPLSQFDGQTSILITNSGSYFSSVSSGPCIAYSTPVQVNFVSCPTVTTSVIYEYCVGQADGSATANVIGGQPPYTYLWIPTNQTTQSATGLASGNYSVIVTDVNGNTGTATVFIGIQALPIAPVIAPSSHSLCDGVLQTFTVQNNSVGNYIWSVTGGTVTAGQGTPQATVLFNTVCNNQTVTLTVNNGNAACSTLVTVPVYSCCGPCNPQTNDIVTDFAPNNITTASQLITYLQSNNHPAFQPPNIYDNNNGGGNRGFLYINNLFTIDVPLELKGSEIRMGANAKIELINGATLTIKNSRLYAFCGKIGRAHV